MTLGGEPKTEVVAPTAAVLDADRVNDKLEVLEKRLRAIEGGSSYEFGDAVSLCLLPNVIIPQNLKCQTLRSTRGPLAQKAI